MLHEIILTDSSSKRAHVWLLWSDDLAVAIWYETTFWLVTVLLEVDITSSLWWLAELFALSVECTFER